MVLNQPNYQITCSTRRALAPGFAAQILATCRVSLNARAEQLSVLDVGCGYGHTSLELAKRCQSVTAIDTCDSFVNFVRHLQAQSAVPNLRIRQQSITELDDRECYDLVVLDNTLEHVAEQELALERISVALRVGGVIYIVVPNKLWPIEVHYGLPFLSCLPLRWANLYLKLTGRGTDYTDACYAPTYFRIRRLLRNRPELSYQFVTPADISVAALGRSLHYRVGVAALRRCRWLWVISKLFLIVARRER